MRYVYIIFFFFAFVLGGCRVNQVSTDRVVIDSTYTIERKEVIHLDSNRLSVAIPISEIRERKEKEKNKHALSLEHPKNKPLIWQQKDITLSLDVLNDSLIIDVLSAPVAEIIVPETYHIRKEKTTIHEGEINKNTSLRDSLVYILWLVLGISLVVLLIRILK